MSMLIVSSHNDLQVAVLVEVLPLSGLPNKSVVAGVSVLPFNLITTKPKLCVKALVSDTKSTKKKDRAKKDIGLKESLV